VRGVKQRARVGQAGGAVCEGLGFVHGELRSQAAEQETAGSEPGHVTSCDPERVWPCGTL